MIDYEETSRIAERNLNDMRQLLVDAERLCALVDDAVDNGDEMLVVETAQELRPRIQAALGLDK